MSLLLAHQRKQLYSSLSSISIRPPKSSTCAPQQSHLLAISVPDQSFSDLNNGPSQPITQIFFTKDALGNIFLSFNHDSYRTRPRLQYSVLRHTCVCCYIPLPTRMMTFLLHMVSSLESSKWHRGIIEACRSNSLGKKNTIISRASLV